MIPITVFLILALDQLTKFLITENLALHESIPVVNGIFSLTLIHNRGAAFGIFKNQLYLFVFVSLVTICLIFFVLKNNRSNRLYSFSLSLVLGGALGNLIDRVFLGYVVDFLDFHIWPVFNVADSAITCGTFILGWLIIKPNKKYAS
ncbi:MAG: signal peptidase II [Candidatus Omnitrophica bacterium]|nr:signal peptidase II [Candidatus Omnitrophota bacterium]